MEPEGIKINNDRLVICKCCDSNACYESEFTTEEGKIQTWLCMTCGFTTNSTMTEDSEGLKQTLELTADLIKDLKQEHLDFEGNKLSWFPTVVNVPSRGMIFPEPRGNSKSEWEWTVVKSIPVTEEEKHKYMNKNTGEHYKYRMDMDNPIRYPKLCFMDAAEELGMFQKDPVEIELTKKSPPIGSSGEFGPTSTSEK